jgi:hypothetical protein
MEDRTMKKTYIKPEIQTVEFAAKCVVMNPFSSVDQEGLGDDTEQKEWDPDNPDEW